MCISGIFSGWQPLWMSLCVYTQYTPYIYIYIYIFTYIPYHTTTYHTIALHYTLRIALHYITLHYITLHCIALHCIALHCIALHCMHTYILWTIQIYTCVYIYIYLCVCMGYQALGTDKIQPELSDPQRMSVWRSCTSSASTWSAWNVIRSPVPRWGSAPVV